jgi:hypothetical protein
MLKRTCLVAAGATLLIGLGPAPAPVLAQQTGLAGIHAWVPVGRKTCMATHTHEGSGNGKTKKDAERAAIRAWESFTIWEYGPSWGRYSLSESKTINCDRSTGSEFSCQVSSRPCISRSAKGRKR